MVLDPGTQFGPYEITGSLGAGGMGEVYRATDTKLKRDVAIKVLAAEPLLGGSLELAAEELRSAQRALSELTGQVSSDDILGAIFSTFASASRRNPTSRFRSDNLPGPVGAL